MHAETVSYSHARQNLASLMNRCVADSQPYLIKGRKASVVMVPYDDWRAEQETAHLLGHPAMAEHLRKSLDELDQGKGIPVSLDDVDKLLGLTDDETANHPVAPCCR